MLNRFHFLLYFLTHRYIKVKKILVIKLLSKNIRWLDLYTITNIQLNQNKGNNYSLDCTKLYIQVSTYYAYKVPKAKLAQWGQILFEVAIDFLYFKALTKCSGLNYRSYLTFRQFFVINMWMQLKAGRGGQANEL